MSALSSYPDRVLTRVLGHDSGNLVGKMIVREVLTGARTYYVRTDGSDSNTGLVNTSGGAFLTIQHAYNTILTIDQNGFAVTIKLGNSGTFTSGLIVTTPSLGGTITLQGDTVTPSNTLISASDFCVSVQCPFALTVDSIKVVSSGGFGLYATNPGASITCTNMDFGTCAAMHMYASGLAKITNINSNYAITGSALRHVQANMGSVVELGGNTVTITGALSFAGGFVDSESCSSILANSWASSGGSVTSTTRYFVGANSVINTFGGGANYFPGDSAGVSSTGGQYI